MSLSLFKVHNCREKAMESNCPVCSEFLFDSADSIKVRTCHNVAACLCAPAPVRTVCGVHTAHSACYGADVRVGGVRGKGKVWAWGPVLEGEHAYAGSVDYQASVVVS